MSTRVLQAACRLFHDVVVRFARVVLDQESLVGMYAYLNAFPTYLVDFWSQGQKILKSDLLGCFLWTSEAKARKGLNRISWDSFYRFLESKPENA